MTKGLLAGPDELKGKDLDIGAPVSPLESHLDALALKESVNYLGKQNALVQDDLAFHDLELRIGVLP